MARDARFEERDLVRRLAALDLPRAAPEGPGAREPAAGALVPADVVAALEEIREAVGVLAAIQGRLQALRRLKERFDRRHPGRTPER